MRAPSCLAALLIVACGTDRAEPAPAPPAAPTPPALAPAPTPAPEMPESPNPPVADSAAAGAAYGALVTAYNERDRDTYLSGFADELRCFYGSADVSHATFEERRWGEPPEGRLAVAKLDVLKRTADEVYFLDRGFWLQSAGGRQVIHEKVVVMRLAGGRWRVVAETNREGLECLGAQVDLSAHASERFSACREEHRACLRGCRDRACRSGCMDGALQCIGIRQVPSTDDGSALALTNVEDVARFVRLSLADQLSGWGGEVEAVGEMGADDERWVRAIQRRVGSPRIRASAEGRASCGPFLVPHSVSLGLTVVGVGEVACTATRDRCVVQLRAERFRAPAEHFALHLIFDGSQLRVSQLEGPRASVIDPSSELDRYATQRPPTWDAPCSPMIEALAEDRVGADFWEVRDAFDDDADVTFTRFCGAAAQRAVRALGDRWLCGERTCGPTYMCGNYCQTISFEGDRVLSHAEGMVFGTLSPERARSLRPRVACGDTLGVLADELTD